jgi:hypothetical protein
MHLLSTNSALRSLIKILNTPAISVQIVLARRKLMLTKILKMKTKLSLMQSNPSIPVSATLHRREELLPVKNRFKR